MRRLSDPRRLAGTVAVLVATAACGPAGQPGPATTPTQEVTPTPGEVTATAAARGDPLEEEHGAAEHMTVWATSIVVGIHEVTELEGEVHANAVELRSHLDFLLREHAALVGHATHAAVGGAYSPRAAVEVALTHNTEELANEIRQLFDSPLAERFEEAWTAHVDHEQRYVEAIVARDATAARVAMQDLRRNADELADTVVALTGGTADRAVVAEDITVHVDTITSAVDVHDQPDQWYGALRDAVDRMGDVAAGLAGAIAEAQRLEGDIDSEVARLRAELAGRMVDDVVFTAMLTRATLAPDEDPAPVEDVVDAVTRSLAETLGEPLGDEFSSHLEDLWHERTDALVAYAEAVAEHVKAEEAGEEIGEAEKAAEEDALKRLHRFSKELATLLEEATGGALGVAIMERDAAEHVRTMTATIDAQAHRV
ncbi:MAG: hypothetical protein M3N57_01805 [Actinomycetota bacterium]|nr:hypothetical protein [Actinomycetota bacterium]